MCKVRKTSGFLWRLLSGTFDNFNPLETSETYRLNRFLVFIINIVNVSLCGLGEVFKKAYRDNLYLGCIIN